jgi:hypothetical protein
MENGAEDFIHLASDKKEEKQDVTKRQVIAGGEDDHIKTCLDGLALHVSGSDDYYVDLQPGSKEEYAEAALISLNHGYQVMEGILVRRSNSNQPDLFFGVIPKKNQPLCHAEAAGNSFAHKKASNLKPGAIGETNIMENSLPTPPKDIVMLGNDNEVVTI